MTRLAYVILFPVLAFIGLIDLALFAVSVYAGAALTRLRNAVPSVELSDDAVSMVVTLWMLAMAGAVLCGRGGVK